MKRCLSLLLLIIAGCGPGDHRGRHTGEATIPDDPCAPKVEIGTGDQFFVPLAEGSQLMMISGPQGGWHMLGSVRVTGTGPEVHIQYEIVHKQTGAIISNNSYNLALLMDEECSGTFVGMYGYLGVEELAQGEADTPPEVLAGDTLVLRMHVQDYDFVEVEGKVEVTAMLDPKDMR